jgi:hypothetical protein
MAKISTTPKDRPTPEDRQPKQDWKRGRYEQRMVKTTARRNITGGF